MQKLPFLVETILQRGEGAFWIEFFSYYGVFNHACDTTEWLSPFRTKGLMILITAFDVNGSCGIRYAYCRMRPSDFQPLIREGAR